MADTAWYYVRNGQPVGPVSLAQLRDFAASKQLLPDSLVIQMGTEAWVPASSILDLFPAKALSAMPETRRSGIPTEAAQAANALMAYLRRIAIECAETVIATSRQSVRLLNFCRAVFRRRSLERQAVRAKLVLGDAIARAGQGEMQLRLQLDSLTTEITAAEVRKQSTKGLQSERRRLVLQLSSLALEQSQLMPGLEPEMVQARKADESFLMQVAAASILRAGLPPKSQVEWRRVSLGYATIAVTVSLSLAMG